MNTGKEARRLTAGVVVHQRQVRIVRRLADQQHVGPASGGPACQRAMAAPPWDETAVARPQAFSRAGGLAPPRWRSWRAGLSRGYTLIEIIGVLAIISILAFAAAHSVLTRMKLTARQVESANLDNLADALRRSILRTRVIPATNTWGNALVTELSLPYNRVTQNALGNPRVMLYDPAFRVGTNSTQAPPWTQTRDGATNLVSPRVLFVSSLAAALPALASDSTTFSNLWNTPPNGVPAGWAAYWSTRGPDIILERIDLGSLFHRLVLENEDGLRTAPYSIVTTNTLTSVPIGGRREMFFLHNTPINLHFYPDPSSAAIVILGHEFITQDTGFVFENGCWNRYLTAGPNAIVGSFGQMGELFRSCGVSGTRVASANTQAALDAMCDYLLYMGLYAQNGFPTDTPTPPITPELRAAYDAQFQFSLVSSNLLK